MSWDRRRKLRLARAYRVMVFQPLGQYPRGTFCVPNGLFHADEEIAFSVVLGEEWDQLDSDAPSSEFNWASPQELRLMTSLVLCERRDAPLVMLYPVVRYGPWLDVESLDLHDPATIQIVRSLILERTRNATSRGSDSLLSGRFTKPYELLDPQHYSLDRLERIWKYVKPTNYVLLRGVYALIKSDMLCKHYEFYEEAIICTYIAMECSFSLVQRRLKLEGCQEPTAAAAAAAKWLHRNFDEWFGLRKPDASDRYFGEFYIERIKTLHPGNRFGDFPYAPIMHGDLHHLRRVLPEVFAFLVLGAHGPDFLEEVREQSRFIDEQA
jgi:hypothetical protein